MPSPESLLMAHVRTPMGDPPRLGEEEAEPLIVRHNGSTIVLELEDGRRYYVDALELAKAVER